MLGTNSKSLKFCRLNSSIINNLGGDIVYNERYDQNESEGIQVIYEQMEHHNGSIYCVDWSRTSRLVATGSNDKMIKILVTPNFEDMEHEQVNW